MAELPLKLYRAAQARELDRIAIEQYGVPGLELMRRAGNAAFAVLRQRYPAARRIAVFCGAGNNGGDGYLVAALALQAGLDARVYAVAPEAQLRGDALSAYEAYRQAGGVAELFAPATASRAEVLVDALLGTGLDRPVGGLFAEAITYINTLDKPVLALDIPSGLHADTGTVLGCAVRAGCTLTFIALKQGLFTGAAAEYCGEILFADLDVPPEIYAGVPYTARRMQPPAFKPRPRIAHKGHHGHVLVIGGDSGYTGAARLAATAAARSGAGLVSIASRAQHAAWLNAACPELMCHGVESKPELEALLAKAAVVAIGPGLGQSSWGRGLLQVALASNLPLVVDADALNLLAQMANRRGNWVLTPHPGEAARLLGCPNNKVNDDRFAAVAALQQQYGGVCVLKGSGTLIATDAEIYVSDTGNPGMASGGMGDVLTGIVAGLAAQGLDLETAARYGVYIHGAAADLAARDGERGMLASDLLPHIRKLVNT